MDQRKFKNKVIEAGSESQDDVLSDIDSKFLPEKTKENEDNADRIQSSGSMANRVMEKKNIPPAKNILTEKIFQENSNQQKQMQQQKTKKRKHLNDDDGEKTKVVDENDEEQESKDMTTNGNTVTSSSALATTNAMDTTADDDDDED